MELGGETVAVVGGFVQHDKAEVLALLLAMDVAASGKITKKTTRVVLGDKPSKTRDRAEAKALAAGLPVHTEADLWGWLSGVPFARVWRSEQRSPSLPVRWTAGEGGFLASSMIWSMAVVPGGLAVLSGVGLELFDADGALRSSGGVPVGKYPRLQPTACEGEVLIVPSPWEHGEPFRRVSVVGEPSVRGEVSVAASPGAHRPFEARATETELVVADPDGVRVMGWDGACRSTFSNALVAHPEDEVALGEAHVAFVRRTAGRAVVQRLSDGAEVCRLEMEAEKGDVASVFLPGDAALVVARSSMWLTGLEVWDVPSGTLRSTIRTYVGPGHVMSLHAAPDGRHVIYRQSGIDVVCVDLVAERVAWALRDVELDAPIAFDGPWVWLGNAKRAVRVALATGRREPTGPVAECKSVALLDGTLLVCSGKDVTLFGAKSGAWKGRLDAEVMCTGDAHRAEVFLLRRKASQGFEQVISRYGVREGLRQPLFETVVNDVAEASGVIVAGSGHFARPEEVFVRRRGGRSAHKLRSGTAERVALSPDGRVALASHGEGLAAWDVETGKALWKTPRGHDGAVVWLGCSPKGGRCHSADGVGLVVRELRTGKVQAFHLLRGAPAGLGWLSEDALWIVHRDGVLDRVDLANGHVEEVGQTGLVVNAAGLGQDGLLALGTSRGTVTLVDAAAALGLVANSPLPPALPAELEDTAPGWARALEALRPDGELSTQDVERVRDALMRLEAAEGIGELHRRWTEALVARGALKLTHGQGHLSPVVGFGLSPCGRYLATAAWLPDGDDLYGGSVVIWEVATARAVNTLSGIDGGVGWPDWAGTVQWSPDGRFLGLAFCTNSVGHFLPFGEEARPLTEATVTGGWSRPPAFCWSPGGDRLAVGCWGPSPVPGGVVELGEASLGEDLARWFARTLPEGVWGEGGEPLELQPQESMRWLGDGRLVGHNRHGQALCVDVASGELRYVARVGEPVAWSPDGRWLAHCAVGLVLYDATTGLPSPHLPMVMGGTSLHWSADSRRLAMVVDETGRHGAEPGVHVFEQGELLGSIDGTPAETPWDLPDACSWAWAPDGTRGALLRAGGGVEVWSVSATPSRLLEIETDLEIRGVVWGAGDVVIGIGPQALGFWAPSDGRTLGAFVVGMERDEGPMLSHSKGDAGEAFALDPGFWVDGLPVCAPPTGPVFASEELVERLDELVAWSADRRLAWPWRWAPGQVYTDMGRWLGDRACAIPASERGALKRAVKERG